MGMAERIKERRLALGYTQEELAGKLGLQKSAIAKYENGRVENIKRSIISKMAEILECSPSYLLDFTDALDNETLEKDDYKTLQIIFDRFGYKLQPFSIHGSYTLQHKKEKEFIIVLSAYELNTMIYDISDYIGQLFDERWKAMQTAAHNPEVPEETPDDSDGSKGTDN